MSDVEELSADEARAYDLITSRNGVLQSDLWKALDADSRTGSRLATSLAEKGLIEREETVSGGHTTYLLTPVEDADSSTQWSGTDAADGEQPTTDDGRDPRRERALALIQERNGIYQSELWKELDVSSRTGSRIASDLEERSLIRREEVTYKGRKTYLLRPAQKDLDFSLLMAGNEISPLIDNQEDLDPVESDAFTQWVLQLAHDQR